MTVKERAKVCIEQFNYPLYESNFVERGYIKGAEEQKQIDIDKACEWLEHHSLLNSVGIEAFRKEMEE